MLIRPSKKEELLKIPQIHRDAFGPEEGKLISSLVERLLQDETALPMISIVAEENGEIIGNVIYSSVKLEGQDQVLGSILAPVAVMPKAQNKGIGSDMIRYGFRILQEQSTDFVMVYGDPAYYKRFGFTREHKVEAPYKLEHPQGWMIKALTGKSSDYSGVIRCAQTLDDPVYW